MKSDKKLDLRSLYTDIRPDPWAVTRLRARLRNEARPSLELVVGRIFKRYVLVASIVLVVLTIVFDQRVLPMDEQLPHEVAVWLYGESVIDGLEADLPDFIFLSDLQD